MTVLWRDRVPWGRYVPKDEVINGDNLPDSVGSAWWLEQFCLFGREP